MAKALRALDFTKYTLDEPIPVRYTSMLTLRVCKMRSANFLVKDIGAFCRLWSELLKNTLIRKVNPKDLPIRMLNGMEPLSKLHYL